MGPRIADLTSPAGDPSAAAEDLDWRDLRPLQSAAHACCCSARPVVTALMPPTPTRRAAELLFCGHHYRAHRHALTAAGATIFDASGALIDSPDMPWRELEAALTAR